MSWEWLKGRRLGAGTARTMVTFEIFFLTFFSGAERGIFGLAVLELGEAEGLEIVRV